MFCSDKLEIDQQNMELHGQSMVVSIYWYVPCAIQKIVHKLNKHTKKN